MATPKKLMLYRVVDLSSGEPIVDEEGCPVDFGALRANTIEEAQSHLVARMKELGLLDLEGDTVTVRIYQVVEVEEGVLGNGEFENVVIRHEED